MGSSLRDTGVEYLRAFKTAASSLAGAAFSRGKDDEGKGPENVLVDLFAPRSVAGARRKVFIQSSVGFLGLLLLILVFSRSWAPAKPVTGVVSHLEVASDVLDKTEILMEEERKLREAMEQREGSSSPKELTPESGTGAGEQAQKPAAAEESLPGASSQTQQTAATAQLEGKEEQKEATEEEEKGPKVPADDSGEDKVEGKAEESEEKDEGKAVDKDEDAAGEKDGEKPELKAAEKEDNEDDKAEEKAEKKSEEKAEKKSEEKAEKKGEEKAEEKEEADPDEGKEAPKAGGKEEEDDDEKASYVKPQVLASEKAGVEDREPSSKGKEAEKEEDEEKDEDSAKPKIETPVEAIKEEPEKAKSESEPAPSKTTESAGTQGRAQGKAKGSGSGEEDDYEGEKGDGKEPVADSAEDSDEDKVEAGKGGEEKEEDLKISDFVKEDSAAAAAGSEGITTDDVTIGNLTKDEDSDKGVAEDVKELEDASAGANAKGVVPSAEAKIVAATAEAVASDPIEYVDPTACQGRTVYIYPLPARFNRALVEQCQTLLPWYNMCPHFLNHGLGKIIRSSTFMRPSARWFETHSYSLEMVFHYRLRRSYKCITADPKAADLYYVPFYASLDVMRWHFRKDATLEATNHLSHSFVRWLAKHESFKKNNGSDHVIVLGKVTWDFRRHGKSTWGNDFLLQPEMKQVTRLLLEADEWDSSDVAVPHLTYFHPRQENDLGVWQREVKNHARNILVSFAALRGMYRNLKEAVGKQCKDDPRNCRYVNCVEDICSSPEATVGLYMDSHFCMVPPGYESVRRAPFDAMLAGCIPVFFDHFFLKQYKWHLPSDPNLYAVHFNGEDVLSGKVSVIKELQTYSMRRIRKMRKGMIHTVLPGLLYNHPKAKPMEDHEDAFDITMDRLFKRIHDRKARSSAVQ